MVGLNYSEYKELPADGQMKTFHISIKLIFAFHVNIWRKNSTFNCKGIAKEIENYEPTRSILSRNLKQTWLNLGNDGSTSVKVIRIQTEQFPELFSRTLNFFAP